MSEDEKLDYIEIFMDYMREQANYVDQIREVKHDMNAHLIMLLHYIQERNYEAAEKYIQALVYQPVFQQYPFVDMGDEAVSAVVHSIMQRTKSEVTLRKDGLLPMYSNVIPMDWCTIFSNLLSNAVEACEKLVYSKKEVVLRLKEDGKDFYISIENPVEWKVEETLLDGGTTKADKDLHGHGLHNVKRIVEKYEGEMEFEILDGTIEIKIFLPGVVRNTPI